MILRFARPRLAEVAVLAGAGAALITVCAVWTAVRPPSALTTLTPSPDPWDALRVGACLGLGLGAIFVGVQWRSLRSQVGAVAPAPAGASLDGRSNLTRALPWLVVWPTLATATTTFHAVAGGLAGGLLLAIALPIAFMRGYVGRWEREHGQRLLSSGEGASLYALGDDDPLPEAPKPPGLWRRVSDRPRLKLWAQRLAAAALALLAAAGTAVVALVLALVAWRVFFPDRSEAASQLVVSQIVEQIALLVLLAAGWFYYFPLRQRFTGEASVRPLVLLPFILLTAIPITVVGRGHGPGAVGERQASELRADLARIFSGRPRETSYEIMLLIDPGSFEGRRLLALAHDDPRAIDARVRGSVAPSVALGVATLERRRDRLDPAMRVVLGLTDQPGAVGRALRHVPPRPGPAAPASVPTALAELTDAFSEPSTLTAGARPGVIRAIVMPFDELPTAAELDAPLARAPPPEFDCPEGFTAAQCEGLFPP